MIKTLLKIVISFNNVILNVAEWEFTVQIITIQEIVWAYFVALLNYLKSEHKKNWLRGARLVWSVSFKHVLVCKMFVIAWPVLKQSAIIF